MTDTSRSTTESTKGSDATEPVLVVRGVSKRYGSVAALSGVDLTILPGEIHALLGQNGAGKSTLIKILNGLEVRDEGEIEIDSVQLPMHFSTHQSRQFGLSFIHQDLGLIDDMTVADNIGLLLGFPKVGLLVNETRVRQQARERLDVLDSNIPPDRLVEELDGAERAMVALARAIIGGAKVIILDEPTARLHGEESQQLFRVIAALAAQGVSFIYVTHRLDEVFQVANRVTVFRDGRSVATSEVSDLDEDALVQQIVGRSVSRQRRVDPTSGSTNRVLTVRGLCTDNLREFDLEVAGGEIVGLTGLVASGANDLGRALFGDLAVSAGTADIAGQAQDWRPRTAMLAGAAYVPADRHGRGLAMDLPVRENIVGLEYVPRWRAGRSGRPGWLKPATPKRERSAAAKAAKRFEIRSDRLDDEVSVLSGGNQQKVLLARWLSEDLRIVILEEPTQGVDVGTRSEIYGLIRGIVADGTAVVIASSDSEEIAQICSRVLVLKDGAVAAVLTGDEISEGRISEESLRSDSNRTRTSEPKDDTHNDK